MIALPPSAAADLLRQIDDIKGLHPVSAWPLAPGWWALIGVAVLLTAAVAVVYLRRRRWRHSWRHDAAQSLSGLETSLNDDNAQVVSAALSEVLRRIAIRKFSRADCAGLQGGDWLSWLKAHDPHNFDWPLHGQILNQTPYAPPGSRLSSQQVRGLIVAARKWVA